MSLLKNFLSSLLPSFKKETVIEDLLTSQKELDQICIPVFTSAVEYFDNNKIKSSLGKNVEDTFFRGFNGNKEKNLVIQILKAFPNIKVNLDYQLNLAEKELDTNIISDSMTALKANIIRSAEHFSMITRYSLELLNYVYQVETADISKEHNLDSDMNKARVKELMNNIYNFALLVSIYSETPKVFEKKVNAIPDIKVNLDSIDSLEATFGKDKIDPFGTNFIKGFDYNPFGFFGRWYAEWQINRYYANKDKKRELELRLLNLNLVANNNPDPKLQKEIAYIQKRVEDFEYKMKKLEDSVQ